MKLKNNFLSIFTVLAMCMVATSTTWAEDTELHSVVVNPSEDGYAVASPTGAAVGTTVSVNIYPDDGCYLMGLVVLDKDGNVLNNALNDFTGGEWYSGGVASFSMPNTNVFITPYFLPIEGRFLEMEMPATGTLSAIIPDVVDFFYINKNYSRENGLIVLSAPEGKVLEISSVQQQAELEDSLYVYDGNNTNSTSLWASTTYDLYRLTSTGRYMTLNFKGNGYYHSKRGRFLVNVLDASETHDITIENSEGGSVKASVGAASVNSTVTLTATPDDGYMLDNIIVDYGEGLRVDVTGGAWYESGPISFKMPSSSVSVKPVFVPVNGARSINMPRRGEVSVAIPEGVDSIKVFDDGGKDGSYSRITDGSLLLSAPEGKKLRITGYARLGSYYSSGTLNVYEKFDNGRNDSLMFYASYNKDNLKAITSGQNMRLDFKVSAYEYLEGLNLTVTVVDPNAPHAINIVSSDNGGFTNPLATALPGEVVTLKANPDEGYVLSRVIVRDEYSEEEYESNVNVIRGSWYSGNEVSFVMPQTDVTVAPSFANLASGYFYLDIEKSGTEDMIIPEGIKSFTVSAGYGSMDEKIDAYIELTAPEGKTLQVIGGVPGRGSADSLYIYSGADTLLKAAKGANIERLSSSNTDLTIHYKEGGEPTKYGPGLSLVFLVADPSKDYEISFSDYINGSVTSNLTSAKMNTPVTLTATPEPGYYLHHVRIFGEQTGFDVFKTGGTWYSEGNEISFLMPGENVVIEPYFASESQVPGVYVSKYETVRATIPDGYQAFHIYGMDIGAWEAAKPLVLTAPQGYLLRMDNVNDEYYTGFNVYNGDVADPVGSNAELMSRPAIAKTMTVVYVGTGYDVSTPVELVKNQLNDIVFGEEISGISEHGTASASTKKAYAGDVVTLTAHPDDGYVLKGMHVLAFDGGNPLDEDNYHSIEFEGGTWYNNEARFVMPLAPVVYTAEFELAEDFGGYEINIPKTGNIAVDIPAGVSFLKVYDDNSGYYGAYSNNSDGSVTLTAPEGYSLYVSGGIRTYEEADSLVIYDGTDVDAPKLLKKSGEETFYDVYSSGRSLTIRFKSNEDWSSYGLELNVVVLKKSGFGAVAIYEADGRTMARIDGNYEGTETVNIPDPIEVDGIEYNRKFTPGVPATVVLPFQLPDGATANADFYQIANVEQEGNRWVATAARVHGTPKANTPYIICPYYDYLGFYNYEYATFQTAKVDTARSKNGDWFFTGTYTYRAWAANDEQLGLAYAFAGSNEDEVSTGEFGRMGAGSYVVPMRAYLSKASADVRLQRPLAVGEVSSIESIPETIDVKFVDGENTMAIGRLNTVTGAIKIDRWFDLKGRSTNHKPTTKGAFFNKKGIVK